MRLMDRNPESLGFTQNGAIDKGTMNPTLYPKGGMVQKKPV
jgi:hypothetical protein